MEANIDELLTEARLAAQRAYAPYSNFTVGAAIRTHSGKIIVGCNVENASYGLCICAERTAATSACVIGERNWQDIAVVSPTAVSPCGACRQFLAEFGLELNVYISGLKEDSPVRTYKLSDLLPDCMSFDSF